MPDHTEKAFYVYMTARKPRVVIYTGMTRALVWRAEQHRDRLLDGFTKTYWASGLVSAGWSISSRTRQRRVHSGAGIS
jgi:predicted GIY-YIG superfamily endonuclease